MTDSPVGPPSASSPPAAAAAADVFDADSDVEEGDGDEHTHFFPLLPSAFSRRLSLSGWHPILLPSSAGRLSLTRDAAFPGQRCVELSCEAGKVDGVGMVYPADDRYIGTALPVVSLHIKNLERYVSFAVDIEDATGRQRTFSASNHQTLARMGEDLCSMPLQLTEGWNKVQLNLAALTRKVFDVEYKYAIRVRVYANCRVRRVFFSDRVYNDWELPLCLRAKPDTNKASTGRQQPERHDGSQAANAQADDEESKEQTSAPAVRVAEVMVL